MRVDQNLVLVLSLFLQTFAFAAPMDLIRWVGTDDSNADFAHVVTVLNQKTGMGFTAADFLLQEDRQLAFTRYQRFEQAVTGVPVEGKAIRIWTDLSSGKAVQVEALVEVPTATMKLAKSSRKTGGLTEQAAIELARAEVMKSSDPSIRGIDTREAFVKGELSRVVIFKGKHGKSFFAISELSHQIVDQRYQSFPDADGVNLNASVFPIYETRESTGETLPRVNATLDNVYTSIPLVTGNPYASLQQEHYYDFNFSPVLGSTDAGRAQGKWSMSVLKDEAKTIRSLLPIVPNTFAKGLLLQGKYATINIYSDAFTKLQGITIPKIPSAAFFPNWIDATFNGNAVTEMVPTSAFYGKPILSAQELLDRPARHLADNDPVSYLNDGFDEIQVYYAINTLFEQLQKGGFQDPDLSTRPFNAFLYDPDVGYRDNAFYTDDTINFTTYSAGGPNMARDNSTIWHELGHGVMDRLMGDNITLADTGGLSEGMADFNAAMVIRSVTAGVPFPGSTEFRIINKTGFFLTNEVHDDGEAYGGTMKDFMDNVTARDGQAGLYKVMDVILETMRLTRDHPGLTAKIWFEHILFADSLGRPGVRAPGEMQAPLMAALNGRNFKMDGSQTASFTLKNVTAGANQEVVAGAPGSRDHEIKLKLAPTDTAHFDLSVALKSSDEYKFIYPVTIKASFSGGPLQGAAHWVGEEKGAKTYVLNSESDSVSIPVDVSGKCDEINREDGSCSDFVYVQVIDPKDPDHPHAKKRFYIDVKN